MYIQALAEEGNKQLDGRSMLADRSDPSWPMGGAKCIGSHKTSCQVLNIGKRVVQVVNTTLYLLYLETEE